MELLIPCKGGKYINARHIVYIAVAEKNNKYAISIVDVNKDNHVFCTIANKDEVEKALKTLKSNFQVLKV